VRLTLFSDYSLRLLLYLAAHPERTVALAEVAGAYGVSQNHLVKVVQKLVAGGFVESARGRGGGLRLACPPETINIGALVRMTEPDMDLVECFERRTNTCPIEPACGLKNVLQSAQRAFLGSLDTHTLADFVPRAPALIKLWRRVPVPAQR
jgi:Rrf2 family nitric oxide-sensitive transcriptional repressor